MNYLSDTQNLVHDVKVMFATFLAVLLVLSIVNQVVKYYRKPKNERKFKQLINLEDE